MKTIKSRKEFEEVFSGGKRANHRFVRVTVLEDGEGVEGKVAFVAPKRLGNAVYRNRCKRVLREAARVCGLPHEGRRVILFATRRTHDCNPTEVAQALSVMLARPGG